MLVRLQGVYQDGTDPAAGVVLNTPRQIDCPLGASLTVQLAVINPGGVKVDLAGCTLLMSVRKKLAWPAQYTPEAVAAATAAGCGCQGSGVGCSSRGCSAPLYGDDTAAVSPAPDLSAAGTLITTQGINRADFVFAPAATQLLVPGRYGYDIWMTKGSSRDSVVPYTPFLILPTATFP